MTDNGEEGANGKLPPICERLVNQLVLLQQRDNELLSFTRSLAQYSADKQTIADKIASAKAQHEKVASVKTALLETYAASRASYQAIVDEDNAKRKEMTTDLQERIDSVNKFAERVTRSHSTVSHENASLKEQIALLQQHRATGEGKFEELVQVREKELENLKERAEKENAREPLLISDYEKTSELTALLRVEHKRWSDLVATFVGKLEQTQQRLTETKHRFDTTKSERDRLVQRIVSAEADRQQAIARAEKSKREHDLEVSKVAEVEQRVGTLVAQIKTLTDLCTALTAPPAATTTDAPKTTPVDASP